MRNVHIKNKIFTHLDKEREFIQSTGINSALLNSFF